MLHALSGALSAAFLPCQSFCCHASSSFWAFGNNTWRWAEKPSPILFKDDLKILKAYTYPGNQGSFGQNDRAFSSRKRGPHLSLFCDGVLHAPVATNPPYFGVSMAMGVPPKWMLYSEKAPLKWMIWGLLFQETSILRFPNKHLMKIDFCSPLIHL